MQLTSPLFLLFFALVCGLNFFVSTPDRRWLQLLASLVFIAAFNVASALAVVLFSTFTFVIARAFSKQRNRFLFFTGIFINVLAIVINNYILSVNGKISFSFGTVDFQAGRVLFAIGLSFYNLQHIAYLVDVQQKRFLPENNYFNFLWASAYFPKFISGPITLYQQLKVQLPVIRPHKTQMWQGFNRLLLGFFKKMVLADRLAPSVSSVFDYNDALPGFTVLMAGVFFTIQLYFDFSGYCDMAIGTSRLLGIELPENFDFPLRSASVTIFWRRWHQSLIHFFTQYVFYPISFRYRKLKKQAVAIAIAVTFFVSALWHGIGFTFMAWALCHFIYLLLELYFRKNISQVQDGKNKSVKLIYAVRVLVLVSFSNLFFRATGTDNALQLVSSVFDPGNFFPASWQVQLVAPLAVGGHQMEHFNLAVTLVFVMLTLLFERKIFAWASSGGFRAVITFSVLLLIFMFGVFNSGQRFIYMQF